jgi:hypothetical protein
MQIQTDIVIIGGGVSGLCTMQSLIKLGFKVLLLENNELGSDQTIRSQGIIHGGLKYALSGSQNAASEALKDMPGFWQDCLEGVGAINLRAVKILANGQYMWSTNRITGGITSLFASNAMRSAVDVVPKEQQPSIIKNSAISSKLYKLHEIVLNIPTLISALAMPIINSCVKVDRNSFNFAIDPIGNIQYVSFTNDGNPIEISAQKFIFTAGTGNEVLQKQLGIVPNMQRRPLHMVLLKDPQLSPLFGHCIGLSSAPRLTITTHIASDHNPVWYLGGKLAEDGVALSSEQQIATAQHELTQIFPNLKLSAPKWASFYVDRAEAKQEDGSKPTSYTIFSKNNYITAWPTKLALAPILAQQIANDLKDQKLQPNFNLATPQLDQFVSPKIATPIWDQLL